ncbi:hypothetical protein [Ramlibacter rhizophilus]|uniref:DUF4398 domain-containing protein n=1 Tax=Ramlibacter rhizophilus TaxID=1781167 RepID=A0A4Z0BG51_9BURK|nr:hypothetical protein [Ramlibacter rhizophilus]TFY97369.1 hypothetical protein EZ242_17740 [Ramlibacter rhizophilus]
MTRSARLLPLVALALAACGSSKPPPPVWQVTAASALERHADAFLSGRERIARAEFNRARDALAATGDATLVARAELTRCALQVAVLQFDPCTGFEALGPEVAAPERAYARYLTGQVLAPGEQALLPAQHRAVAAGAGLSGLRAITDPTARLVATGVQLRAGRAEPGTLQLAVDTASAQGWRRALLGWLGAQVRRAEQAGDAEEAARLRRRMALVGGESAR